ncbi:XrtA/PEP-CTERM system TPR-repeat protein PrsT [Pelomonas sp. KK5]|uniref:XrtA/PEP-CTERM system TPR-repeat protein PrsT n=1 Tax=Pelomonas sp. KK5 TaxID=1855730 RepID=UPI00097C7331|nr:XrtA/PEP-CTERM system TPR-repeat protein PrsT [Pelomonas sp. KK5]
MTTSFKRHVLVAALLIATAGAGFAQGDTGKAARFYEDALQRYDRKDYAGAIIQLKNSLQQDKNQLSVHLLLGKALLANAEVANAELEFNEALRLGVNRGEIVVQLAQAMVAQGKQAQLFDDARLKPAGLPPGVLLKLKLVLASAWSDVGDNRQALQAVMDARAVNPADAASWLAEVPLRVRSRQFKEATAAAEQALKLAPDSAEAAYQKASILHVQGQIADALQLYERSIKLDNGNVDAHLARAGLLLDLYRDKEAQTEIDELRRLAPNDPRGTYLRAQVAERAGDMPAAKAALKRVTELLDPVPIEYIRYRVQLLMLNGLSHYDLKEFEKAKPYLEYAAKQQPNSPLTKLLAQIALAEPNVPRAIDLLETYLKSRPGDGQALLMLASAQMSQGRHAKATALLQEALQAKDSPDFRAALGLSLMRGGKSADATAELERAYKADPKQIQAGLVLVDMYLKAGQQAKALQVADSLAKANPANPTILLVQASARLRARDVAGARAGYQAALKIDPKLLPAQLGMARLELTTRDFAAADNRLRTLLRSDERNVDVLFELATLYETWGKDDKALGYLQSAADASSPTQTRANYALVAWQLRKGTPGGALDAAKVLLSKRPDDIEALLVYSQAQLASADFAGARATLTNASRRAAYDATQLERIARAQLDAKDLAGAAYSLDKALQGSPNFLPAMVLMSTVELMQNDPAKAERRARQVIQGWPKAAIGYGLLADVAASRGQQAAAVDALRHAYELEKTAPNLLRLFRAQSQVPEGGKAAIELAQGWIKAHPKDTAVQKALADAHARAGNFTAARHGYEAVVAQQPGDLEAMNNLANVLIRQKDPGAPAVAEKALALDPRNAVVIDTAGWAHFIAGNRDRALQLLRDARLRNPANPDVRYHLAAVLAQTGRSGEAREELEAALKSHSFASADDARQLMSTLK